MTSDSIALAGGIGSGKTTIAGQLAARLGLPRVGFGDHVRDVARERGIAAARESLQSLGEELAGRGWEPFCRAVLAQADWRPGRALVIDGVRHMETVDVLRSLMSPGGVRLVVIATPDELRAARVKARDAAAAGDLVRADAHSTEAQVRTALPAAADLVVDGSRPPAVIVDEIVAWLAGRKPIQQHLARSRT